MNTEEIMRNTMETMQEMFCKEHNIPESQFDLDYKHYRLQGFTVEDSRKWAYERNPK